MQPTLDGLRPKLLHDRCTVGQSPANLAKAVNEQRPLVLLAAWVYLAVCGLLHLSCSLLCCVLSWQCVQKVATVLVASWAPAESQRMQRSVSSSSKLRRKVFALLDLVS